MAVFLGFRKKTQQTKNEFPEKITQIFTLTHTYTCNEKQFHCIFPTKVVEMGNSANEQKASKKNDEKRTGKNNRRNDTTSSMQTAKHFKRFRDCDINTGHKMAYIYAAISFFLNCWWVVVSTILLYLFCSLSVCVFSCSLHLFRLFCFEIGWRN